MPIQVNHSYQRLREQQADQNEKELLKEFISKLGVDQGIARLSEITGSSPDTYKRVAASLSARFRYLVAGLD